MGSKKQSQEETPIDVAPFDMLRQKEQWSHLLKYHTWEAHHNLNSKARKDDYQAVHERSHLRDEYVMTPHTHTAVAALAGSPSEPGSSSDLKGADLSQPLSVTQRRALKDLVENDFLTMRAEIQQFADDMAKQRREEITGEWTERGSSADAYEARGQALMDAYREGSKALRDEALTAGVDLSMPKIKDSYPKLEAHVPGLQEALRAMEGEVESDRRRALNTLERSRLTAQRKVLLTGVTQEALTVLDTIPTARSLMLQAAAERTGKPAEALL